MAMTKRYKVTFEITAKLSTKEVEEFTTFSPATVEVLK